MSLFYRFAYWLGVTPWEAQHHPVAAAQIEALFDREQSGRDPPFGRVLDVGCGRGYWSINLSQRGWQVTGVDLVNKAIAAARKNAAEKGVDVTFIEADVTGMSGQGLTPGFNLFWDFGTLHGLPPQAFKGAAGEIDLLAGPDAVLLLLAWAPGARSPLPRGLGRDEIESAFPNWRVLNIESFDATGLPPPLRRVDPHIHRLQRTQQ